MAPSMHHIDFNARSASYARRILKSSSNLAFHPLDVLSSGEHAHPGSSGSAK